MLYTSDFLLDVVVDPVDEFFYDYGTTIAVCAVLAAVVVATLIILRIRRRK